MIELLIFLLWVSNWLWFVAFTSYRGEVIRQVKALKKETK